MAILIWVVFGILAGITVNILEPRKSTLLGTVLLGVLGAILGGFLGNFFFGDKESLLIQILVLFIALIGASGLVAIQRLASRR